MIVNPVSLSDKFAKFAEQDDARKAMSTGYKNLDKRMRLAKGFVSVISGYPSNGKTEFLDQLLVNMSVLPSRWNHLIFSPENGGTEQHMTRLAEKYIGKKSNDFTPEESRTALKWLETYFKWITNENPTLDSIINDATELAESAFLDSLTVDPWNEIMHKKQGMTHDYLAEALMRFRQFARKYNTHVFIVAHPKIPERDTNGVHRMPELYDITDGSMWRNKADYGWIAHRPDMSKNQVQISVQKVKFKWMGQYMAPLLFDYDRDCSGRFKEATDEHYLLPAESPF